MHLYPVPRHERSHLSCPPQDTKQKNLTDELLTAQGTNCIYAHIDIAPCTYSVDGALTGPSVLLPDCPRSLIETILGTSTSSVSSLPTTSPATQTSASSAPSSSSDHNAGSQGGANSQPAAGPPGYSNTYSSDAQIPATSIIVASSGTTGSYSSGSSVKKPPSPVSAVGIALGTLTFLLLCLCLGFWLRSRVLLRKRRAAAVARLGEIAYFPDGLVAPSPSTTRFARNESVAATANENVAAWIQRGSSAVHSMYSAESEKDSEGSRTKERELQFQLWSVQEPFPAYAFSRGLSASTHRTNI